MNTAQIYQSMAKTDKKCKSEELPQHHTKSTIKKQNSQDSEANI